MRLYDWILLGAILTSCGATRKEELPNQPSAFSDVTLCRIYDLGQRKNYTQLLPYLQHPQPLYRKAAVKEFAGATERHIADLVLTMLADTSEEVRAEAAFILGYIADSTLTPNLIVLLQEENQPNTVRYELVKAIGRNADSLALDWLVSYQSEDPAYLYAQAVAVASARKRGVTTRKVNTFLQNYPDKSIANRIDAIQPTTLKDSISYLSLNLETRAKITAFADTLLAWEQAKNWQKYVYVTLRTNQQPIAVRLYLDENPTVVTRLAQLANQQYFQHTIFRETADIYAWELPDTLYELPNRPLRGSIQEGTVFVYRERQKIRLCVAKKPLPDYESDANIIGVQY